MSDATLSTLQFSEENFESFQHKTVDSRNTNAKDLNNGNVSRYGGFTYTGTTKKVYRTFSF